LSYYTISFWNTYVLLKCIIMQTLSHSIICNRILHIAFHVHLLLFRDFLIYADDSQLCQFLMKNDLICILLDIKSFLIFISFNDSISTRNELQLDK